MSIDLLRVAPLVHRIRFWGPTLGWWGFGVFFAEQKRCEGCGEPTSRVSEYWHDEGQPMRLCRECDVPDAESS